MANISFVVPSSRLTGLDELDKVEYTSIRFLLIGWFSGYTSCLIIFGVVEGRYGTSYVVPMELKKDKRPHIDYRWG